MNDIAGRYEIEREIGAGGMATVYLARDLKHNRQVALKVLRPELGAVLGPDRFLSEINVTANLQHPHLLPLFDSGEAEGLLFYVMPYVAGESLRARLERERQLPVDEALRITAAIASALSYAHRHGVVHRDLKPENILLHDGQPLVTDFGIALAVSNAGGMRVTQTGLSLGTPQYMSPEQATGDRVIDARSDVYSLAAVLYEMLTGDPPHAAGTTQGVIAKVLTEKPVAPRTYRPSIPANVEAAVLRGLEKLPADRFATADEFARALSDEHYVVRNASVAYSRWAVAAGMLALVLASVGGTAVWLHEPPPIPAPPTRSFVTIEGRLHGWRRIAVSRDGRLLAWSEREQLSGAPAAIRVRRSDELESRRIAGTAGGRDPAFSPRGDAIVFIHGDTLKRVSLDGGEPAVIAHFPSPPEVPVWTNDDRILAAIEPGVIVSVPVAGGAIDTLVRVDSILGAAVNPQQLPNGALMYTTWGGGGGGGWIRARLPNGEIRQLIEGTDARYLASGHLLFGRAEGIFAVPFDLRRMRVLGEPRQVLSQASLNDGVLTLDISETGTLFYRSVGERRGVLTEVDGDAMRPLPVPPEIVRGVAYSPDGRYVVYGTSELLVFDLLLGHVTKLDTGPRRGYDPVWNAAGDSIAFHTLATGSARYVGQIAPRDGSGSPRLLFDDARLTAPQGWLPDGKLLARGRADGKLTGGMDLYVVSGTTATPFLTASWNESHPAISPSGRAIAFMSDETGTPQIYVRPYPDPAGWKLQVSVTNGRDPVWSNDGRLFYWEGEAIRAARLELGANPRVVAREIILQDPQYVVSCCAPNFDVHPNGRTIILARSQDATPEGITMVSNWFTELRERLSAGERR